jgi:hypothetical protein
MGFTFGPDGDVMSVPEEIKTALKDEVAALMREVGENEAPDDEITDVDVRLPEPAQSEPVLVKAPAAVQKDEEEELPQTQMAAAFAALKLDDLTSDPPAEETKA